MPKYFGGTHVTQMIHGQKIAKRYRGDKLYYQAFLATGTVIWTGDINPSGTASPVSTTTVTLTQSVSKIGPSGIQIKLGANFNLHAYGGASYDYFAAALPVTLNGTGIVTTADLKTGKSITYNTVSGGGGSINYGMDPMLSPFTFTLAGGYALTVQMVDNTHLKIGLGVGDYTGYDTQHNAATGEAQGHESETMTAGLELLQITAL